MLFFLSTMALTHEKNGKCVPMTLPRNTLNYFMLFNKNSINAIIL